YRDVVAAPFCIFCSYCQMGLQFPGHLSTRQDPLLSKLPSQQSL
ncbi:DNAH9 isoform 13, partial [Pongo abelii]